MCLAAAGAGYQALLRNPLAEPYLLGVSNGAAVGTMTALVFFGGYEWSRPLMAFAGALAATFVVYQLARGRAGATPERLILAGIIVTTFLSSAIVFITTLMDAAHSLVHISGCWAIFPAPPRGCWAWHSSALRLVSAFW